MPEWKFALCGGYLPRTVLMSSVCFPLNFVNLPRIFYKLSNLGHLLVFADSQTQTGYKIINMDSSPIIELAMLRSLFKYMATFLKTSKDLKCMTKM